jgi:hypothetical protein
MRPFRSRKGQGQARALSDALDRTRQHALRATGAPIDVQLLGQVSGSQDWPRIFEHWTHRGGLTGSWPRQLAANELVLNLWPISPGTLRLNTGLAAKPEKRQPRKLLSTPWLLGFDPTEKDMTGEGALLTAIPQWIDDVVFEHGEYPNGVRLAPPILEEWASKGRLVRRRVITFDLAWPLPPADDLTWPPPTTASP